MESLPSTPPLDSRKLSTVSDPGQLPPESEHYFVRSGNRYRSLKLTPSDAQNKRMHRFMSFRNSKDKPELVSLKTVSSTNPPSSTDRTHQRCVSSSNSSNSLSSDLQPLLESEEQELTTKDLISILESGSSWQSIMTQGELQLSPEAINSLVDGKPFLELLLEKQHKAAFIECYLIKIDFQLNEKNIDSLIDLLIKYESSDYLIDVIEKNDVIFSIEQIKKLITSSASNETLKLVVSAYESHFQALTDGKEAKEINELCIEHRRYFHCNVSTLVLLFNNPSLSEANLAEVRAGLFLKNFGEYLVNIQKEGSIVLIQDLAMTITFDHSDNSIFERILIRKLNQCEYVTYNMDLNTPVKCLTNQGVYSERTTLVEYALSKQLTNKALALIIQGAHIAAETTVHKQLDLAPLSTAEIKSLKEQVLKKTPHTNETVLDLFALNIDPVEIMQVIKQFSSSKSELFDPKAPVRNTTLLEYAVTHKKFSYILMLIECQPIEGKYQNSPCWTADLAKRNAKDVLIKVYRSSVYSINSYDLHIIIKLDLGTDVLKHVLQKSKQAKAQDNNGKVTTDVTPFNSLDINCRTSEEGDAIGLTDKKTAIEVSYESRNYDYATILLEAGANLDVTTARGGTLLHIAAENNDLDFIRTVLPSIKSEAPKADKTYSGKGLWSLEYGTQNTPIHYAFEHASSSVIEILLPVTPFAVLELRNKDQKTPLDLYLSRFGPEHAARFFAQMCSATGLLRQHEADMENLMKQTQKRLAESTLEFQKVIDKDKNTTTAKTIEADLMERYDQAFTFGAPVKQSLTQLLSKSEAIALKANQFDKAKENLERFQALLNTAKQKANISKEVASKAKKYDQAQVELTKLQTELKELKQSYSKLEIKAQENDQAQATISSLEVELQRYKDNADLLQPSSKSNEQFEQLKQKLNSIQIFVDKLKTKDKATKELLTKEQEKNAQLERENLQLKQEIEKLKAALQQQKAN